jgi:ATP-dependent Zn protease
MDHENSVVQIPTATLEYLCALHDMRKLNTNPIEVLSRIINAPIDDGQVMQWLFDFQARPPEHVAYHEAGHAIVGHVLGLSIDIVSIVPDMGSIQNSAGCCNFKSGKENDQDEKLLYIKLAGFHAEKMAFGYEDCDGSSSDFGGAFHIISDAIDDDDEYQQQVDNLIKTNVIKICDDGSIENEEAVIELHEKEHEKRQDAAEVQVKRILSENWIAVATLANALLRYQVIRGDEAHKIIEEALKKNHVEPVLLDFRVY